LDYFAWKWALNLNPLARTQERESTVSAEPDESYCFSTSKPSPDLVIEVIFTSGSPNKLQRYRLLDIPEVWFWEDGVFSLLVAPSGLSIG